tara:strand:- start:197 stop:2170 length:1974 start_codon:yes stop_codon:yes gene_type:complete
MSSYRKTMKEALEEVSLYGQKLEEAMPPTKHVSSEGDKFVVKDMNGKVVQKFMDKDEADEYATKNHDKLMSAEEVEEEIEEEEADLDEASKLPPHLAKFFDKKGNLKPDAAKRVAKGKSKKDVASRTTDVTPKGYGPSEEIEEEEVDEGIIGNLAKAAGTAVVKKVSDVVKDKTVGAVSRTVKKVSDKVSDATGVTAVKKGVNKVGNVISKVKGAANKIKKAAQTGEEVDLDDKNKLNEEELGEQIVNKNYLETKSGSIEQSVMEIWKNATVVTEKKLDPVGKEDGDIDNDGDKDSSDKYLAKRRKAISKSMKKEEEEVDLDESNPAKMSDDVLKSRLAQMEKSLKIHVDSPATQFEIKRLKKEMKKRGIQEEVEIDEAKMSSAQIAKLKKAYEPMRDKRISIDNANKLSAMMDKVSKDKETLIQLFKADIPFVSNSAVTKLISKHDMKGAEINKLREEIEMDANESYEMGTDEYRNHTQSITPGQEVTDYQNFKVESMKETLAKVWGLDEWKNTKENRRVDGGDKRRLENKVKSGKTITGKTSDVIDLKPTTEEKQLDEILPALAAPVAGYVAKKAIGAVAKKVMGPKEEEKMITANYMIKSGKSAEDVAKVINVDVKEIKKVMSAYHDEQNSHYKEYLAAACSGDAMKAAGAMGA